MTNKSDVKNVAEEAQDQIANTEDKAADKAQEVQGMVASYVKRNPLKSLGAGILIGMGLCALLPLGKR